MTLSEIILAVMLSTRPADTEDEALRLRPVAEAVALEAESAPLFGGDAKKTALLLTSIAIHESGLREAVRRCHVNGDAGNSIGLAQLHRGFAWGMHSAAEICASDALQARLALRVLAHHRDRGASSVPAMLRGYASGDPGRNTRAARELAAGFERAVRRADALEETTVIELWSPRRPPIFASTARRASRST